MNDDQIVAALDATYSASEQEITALRDEIVVLTHNLEATVDRQAGSRDSIVRLRKKVRGQKERLREAHERREALEVELENLKVYHVGELAGIKLALAMLGHIK